MSSTALAFTIALAHAVDPDHDHSTMVEAIAKVAIASPPLFADDADREKTLALIVAVAWREGSLGDRVEGDCSQSKPGAPCKGTPSSWCSLQINLPSNARTLEGWSGPELRDDAEKCVTTGLRMLRVSARVCPDFPLAFYASGPVGFRGDRAKRISRDRMALAGRLRAQAKEAIAKASEGEGS